MEVGSRLRAGKYLTMRAMEPLTNEHRLAQEKFDAAKVRDCRSCGAPARLSWKTGGYAIECVKRFDGCPMNARTHRDPSVEEVIIRWEQRSRNEIAPPEIVNENFKLTDFYETPLAAFHAGWRAAEDRV